MRFLKLNFGKNGMFSVFEIAIVFLLLSFSFQYFNNYSSSLKLDEGNKFMIDSSLDSLYNTNSFRDTIMVEDLSNSNIIENWDPIFSYLNSSFLNYELILSNLTTSKIIKSCNATTEKYLSERIFAIKNNTIYEFRMLRLGVCY